MSEQSGQEPQYFAAKKSVSNFLIGRVLGEGSFSTVFVAREKATEIDYALKIINKRLIIREKKTHIVTREKQILSKINHPFFIRLYFTFQDDTSLYYGLTYAKGGEIRDYIKKRNGFSVPTVRFYAAELFIALNYLHCNNIIHRDLKPENVLLSDKLHILVADFGTAKIVKTTASGAPNLSSNNLVFSETSLNLNTDEVAATPSMENLDRATNTNTPNDEGRANSFVGTAQYVSPELLQKKYCVFSSDIWALGCMIYQMAIDSFPFFGINEYHIFQKIVKCEYSFPANFPPAIKNIVQEILLLDPEKRLGCFEMGGINRVRQHEFFRDFDFDTVAASKPPEEIVQLFHSITFDEHFSDEEELFNDSVNRNEAKPSNVNLNMNDPKIAGTIIGINKSSASPRNNNNNNNNNSNNVAGKEEILKQQSIDNIWHKFVENNVIIRSGFLYKKKGLFPRRRMFLITEGPNIYYVDPISMELKGRIPWDRTLSTSAKNFSHFYIHTPNRTYILEDRKHGAHSWIETIENVHRRYFK